MNMSTPLTCFDSHCHIIDPSYPLTPNQGFSPDAFTSETYMEAMTNLALKPLGGAVVSGSFQAFDTDYLQHALNCLGPNYVGVINLKHNASDDEILNYHRMGVRAVRFNLFRGGSETIDHIEALAHRIYQLCQWHVELYVSADTLMDIKSTLVTLPKISIDHLGLTTKGLDDVLELASFGAHIKTTRFSLLDFDIAKVMREIYDANPNSLMFGTDLPGTRAPRTIDARDIDLIKKTFSETERANVLHQNAYHFYHGRFNSKEDTEKVKPT
jgi:predicted TIM-barrel fold metal-dependent hydrolase